MTVKELKAELDKFDDSLIVIVRESGDMGDWKELTNITTSNGSYETEAGYVKNGIYDVLELE